MEQIIMATIKSYTDLQQSKQLADILPLESADMCYKCIEDAPYDVICRPYSSWKEEYIGLLVRGDANVIPCWSLAALLDILPKSEDKAFDVSYGHYDNDTYISKWYISYVDNSKNIPFIKMIDGDNLIDIVVQLLIYLKANEQI